MSRPAVCERFCVVAVCDRSDAAEAGRKDGQHIVSAACHLIYRSDRLDCSCKIKTLSSATQTMCLRVLPQLGGGPIFSEYLIWRRFLTDCDEAIFANGSFSNRALPAGGHSRGAFKSNTKLVPLRFLCSADSIHLHNSHQPPSSSSVAHPLRVMEIALL